MDPETAKAIREACGVEKQGFAWGRLINALIVSFSVGFVVYLATHLSIK